MVECIDVVEKTRNVRLNSNYFLSVQCSDVAVGLTLVDNRVERRNVVSFLVRLMTC